MNYIMAGMKHCGKSTLGKRLAEYLCCPFYDTDDLIRDKFNHANNCELTIRQIYSSHGQDFFKQQEMAVLRELKEHILKDAPDNVVALGGGLPVNIDLILLLHRIGTVIYLKDNPDVLYLRTSRTGLAPFLDKKNPKESFLELYKEREPYYILHADIRLNLENCSIDEAWEKVRAAVANHAKK